MVATACDAANATGYKHLLPAGTHSFMGMRHKYTNKCCSIVAHNAQTNQQVRRASSERWCPALQITRALSMSSSASRTTMPHLYLFLLKSRTTSFVHYGQTVCTKLRNTRPYDSTRILPSSANSSQRAQLQVCPEMLVISAIASYLS